MSARPKRALIAPGLLSAGAVLLLAASVTAQDAAAGSEADGRWLPFTGCWEATAPAGEGQGEEMLCVRPDGEGPDVEFLTVVDGRVIARETRRGDGARRPVSREGCEGWERTAFSDDGHRVHLRAEHVCRGEVDRVTTGLMAMISPYEWVDVRAVGVGEGSRAWVRRYRAAPEERARAAGLGDISTGLGMAVESARMAAASAPGVEDVIEASREVDARAVEAWIAELGDPFDLDGDALLRMADAGVSERVIDVVVAVSYPDRFDLDRGGEVTARTDAGRIDGRRPAYGARGRYGGYGPYPGYGPGYRPVHGHGFSYGLFYSPWRSYGGYGFYRGYRPSVVVVQPRDDRPSGRVVNGRGYTRGSGGSPPPSRAVVPRGGSRDGGGSVSPSGARQGDSSSSTGRKAKKKGGGSGGDGGDGGGSGSGLLR